MGRRFLSTVVIMVLATCAGAAPGTPPPEGKGWIRPYLHGLDLEKGSRWLMAAEQFRHAIQLHPEPEAEVVLQDSVRVTYAPYAHLVYVLTRAGAPRALVEPLLEKAREGGVAPTAQLDRLAKLVADLPEGDPQEWLESVRRPPFPRLSGGRRPPLLASRQSGPSAVASAEPTPSAVPPTHTPRPTPSPTPLPARVSLPEDTPAEITLRVDGRDLAHGVRTAELSPGRHTVAAVRGGEVLLERVFDLQPGQSLTILPVAAPTPTPTPTATLPPDIQRADAVLTAMARATRWLLPLSGLLIGLILWLRNRAGREKPASPAPQGPTVASRRPPVVPSPTGHPGSLAGRMIGGYELLDRLGTGGMATTWRARRVSDDREVALKIPHEHCIQDERSRARFLREGKLGEQLHHPNIVRVLEAGEEDGWPFLAMELVRGRTLRELLRTTGELPLERALEITRQVAEALDYAHAKGVIHRDLKPENLMIEAGGRVRVMDFGIARLEGGTALTATSVFVGTPAYAAPETIEGETAGPAADLYALGIVLFEMLEGSAPFADTSPLEQLRRHLKGEFPERGDLPRPLPDALWELVLALVARNPADRLPSAQALLLRIRELQRAFEEGLLGP